MRFIFPILLALSLPLAHAAGRPESLNCYEKAYAIQSMQSRSAATLCASVRSPDDTAIVLNCYNQAYGIRSMQSDDGALLCAYVRSAADIEVVLNCYQQAYEIRSVQSDTSAALCAQAAIK